MQIYSEVLLDANTASSHFLADTDGSIERADDAVDEGCYVATRKYESTDEPTGAAENSDGV